MRCAALVVFLCVAAGCSKPSTLEPNLPPSIALASAIEPVPSSEAAAADLRKTADDPRADRATRAAAVFALFADHLRAPCGPTAVGKVLGEGGWLKGAKFDGMLFGIAGWIPVEFGGDASVYCLRLFPDKDGQSDWCIFLRLSGGSYRPEGDVRAFLRGDKDLKGAPELVEFALCYPHPTDEMEYGRFERFNSKGMTANDVPRPRVQNPRAFGR